MRLKVLFAAVVLALPGAIAAAAPAQANPVEYCRWLQKTTKPYYSNCDNQNFFFAEDCEISGPGDQTFSVPIGHNVTVSMEYVYGGGGCRSVRARMYIGGAVPPGSNCYVTIKRSDGKQLYTSEIVPGDSDQYQYTNILYDADTTAHAFGHCDRPGIGLARGSTRSY